MEFLDIIKTRKSVRTFDGRQLSDNDKTKLTVFIENTANPYGIPVDFVFLDKKEHRLSSPVISGETEYVALKVPKTPHCEEALGFSFEKFVLYAWSLGIGTTWIGGTMNRKLFEKAADTKEYEIMPIVSPLGYPSKTLSWIDKQLRKHVHGNDRLSADDLFFENDFSTPLKNISDSLEAVRFAPSAVNNQPWRVVKDGSRYHFYEKHMKSYNPNSPWDIQKIDMGIALYHFIAISGGNLEISDPCVKTDSDIEYIATVNV
ncbi:MAG: nitroreductase [Clostridia bacterium]|nr:nitroreductase [Clostridia bacterium]